MPRAFAPRLGRTASARKPLAFVFVLVAACCAALASAPFPSQVVRSQGEAGVRRALSLRERVAFQRAVEEVYWRHAVWPKENAGAKPSLEEVLTPEQTAAKVEDALRKSEALARRWGRPVTAEQLQAELTRQARETKRPEVLRGLWQALGNDPYVIAEVLARPALVDRLARSSFDGEAKAEGTEAAAFDSWWAAESQKFSAEISTDADFAYQLVEIAAGGDDTWTPTPSLPVGNGTAVWTGTEMLVWGGQTSLGGRTNTGSRYNPATDTWTPTTTVNAPLPRSGHTAVWTGAEMLVWGGSLGTTTWGDGGGGSGATSTGGRYNPSTDSWTPTSTSGAPFLSGHLSVWTGSTLVVWGPSAGTGAIYDPSADSWKATSRTNAPGTNIGHRAVWTGAEMFIWGGGNATTGKRGGLYNPSTDSWRQPNTFNAPSERTGFTLVWTGAEAVVWGGYEGNFITLNTGGRYNPQTDTWTPTSTANSAAARFGHTAVWTGAEMVVYGGDLRPTGNVDQVTNTGGRYDPLNDSWTLTSTAGAPLKNNHVAVWTGTEMIVWGGRHVSQTVFREGARYSPSQASWTPTNSADAVPSVDRGVWTGAELLVWGHNAFCYGCASVGGRYDPATNVWRPMSVAGAPTATGSGPGNSAVWTGKEMLVWGGIASGSDGGYRGGRYNPLTDSWTLTSTTNAPRAGYTSVWTGKELIVWGNATLEGADAGGRYNPETDTWRPTSTVGAPTGRSLHTAVWTGTEMVVWGGVQYAGPYLNTGGRYNPETDTWRPTSVEGAPDARTYHTAVWTGAEMVVWGGNVVPDMSGFVNTGGRYDPQTDTWRPTGTVGVPEARSNHRAVWTGSQIIVWGGNVKGVVGPVTTYTGARYSPASDAWTATSLRGTPTSRHSHVQVWTGTQMIVWGGTANSGAPTNDGALYNAHGAAPGNALPSVRLTAPAGGTTFQSGGPVNINVEASDPDGSVSAVRFYANDTLIGTDAQSPFVFDWTEVRGGSYALTATAIDNVGGESRSIAVNITVTPSTAPPVCVLTNPADGASYAYNDAFYMEATATANRDRAIARVEFFDNDRLLTYYEPPTYNAPWRHYYETREPGTRSLTARCTDNAGGVTTSAPKVITVAEQGFSVSGQVMDDRGFIIAGIRLRLDGPAGTAPRYATTTVAGNGNYYFGGLKPGETYTVTPEPGAWKFAPESNTYTSISRSYTVAHFYGTRAGYGIQGRLLDAGGNPIYPATVNLSGSKTASAGVDVNGYYFFSNLAPGGTYTVQPYKNLYAFEPNFRTFENLSAEQTANFDGASLATPTPTPVEQSQFVIADPAPFEEGAASVAVTVRRTGDASQAASVDYATADGTARQGYDYMMARGSLRFAAGETEKQVNIILIDDAHDEAEETFTLSLSAPRGGTQLNATASAQLVIKSSTEILGMPNPADDARFFVRQHYADFLNRVPDEAGLEYWTRGIEACGPDAQCREVARIDVSAAFFLSIEFQETGYLIHRLQKATDGQLPRYAEFMRQAQEISSGVVVGTQGWAARLEINKREFVDRWTQTESFKARYDAMTGEQYVDALIANTGVEPGREFRDALVAAVVGGSESRAGALRRVAEQEQVRSAEMSRAFVLMQYFGYLRRNPDDAPDTGFGGFNFWLRKLDEFGGDYRRAEMVRAFLDSIEYRRRFAP